MHKEDILRIIDRKPSKALQLMLDGLLDKDRGFDVSMATFGSKDTFGKCFGCAATCATLKVFQQDGVEFRLEAPIRRSVHGIYGFELAMNQARKGDLDYLFGYCGLDARDADPYNGKIYLSTGGWSKRIDEVRKLIQELQQNNL